MNNSKALLILSGLIASAAPSTASAQNEDFVAQPYVVNVPVESRSITFENPTGEKGKGSMTASKIGIGRKGAALKNLDPGQTVTLCNIAGPGVIRRMWATVPAKKENLLGFVLRGYWDGQKTPSIEAPLGEFFGSAHGVAAAYQSAVHSMTDSAGMSIFLPMPFLRSARFTVTNEGTERDVPFYYAIDYTIKERLSEDVGRLHVMYRRENPTTLGRDFQILPRRRGLGRFVGCVLGIDNSDRQWWGEGEFKVYLDGDESFPTLVGTGTEDYIGQAWGFHKLAYLYGGVSQWEEPLLTLYRWHLKDPIYWKKDILVTLQQLGAKEGVGYYDKQEDVSAAAFWYEPIPSAPLPTLPDYAARIAPGYAAMPLQEAKDVYVPK
jgi:hypothetical protein